MDKDTTNPIEALKYYTDWSECRRIVSAKDNGQYLGDTLDTKKAKQALTAIQNGEWLVISKEELEGMKREYPDKYDNGYSDREYCAEIRATNEIIDELIKKAGKHD